MPRFASLCATKVRLAGLKPAVARLRMCIPLVAGFESEGSPMTYSIFIDMRNVTHYGLP
jgi:hypothetical protein